MMNPFTDRLKGYLPALAIGIITICIVIIAGSAIFSWYLQCNIGEIPPRKSEWTTEQIEHDYQQYDTCEKDAIREFAAALQRTDPAQVTRKKINYYNQILGEASGKCCATYTRGCMENARIHARENLPIDSELSE